MIDLPALIAQGEHASLEFKQENVRTEALAREFTPFANTLGGQVCMGSNDDGCVSEIIDQAIMDSKLRQNSTGFKLYTRWNSVLTMRFSIMGDGPEE